MAQGLDVDIREIVLSNTAFGPAEVDLITRSISEDYSQFGELRDAVAELEVREDRTPATAVRLGVCYYLLGRYERAIQTLKSADGGAMAQFYLARSYFALERYDEALEALAAARTAGYDPDEVALREAEAYRYAGNPEKALQILDDLSGPVEQTAEYLYQRGATVAALGGNPQEVIALYERAIAVDEGHPGALFGLALENDRYGNDRDALLYYQRAVSRFPAHVGALINLGLLYEDLDQYDKAVACYQRVLDVYPAHPRARLYLKDAEASGDMFVDEEERRRHDRMAQLLATPVTDFELSVRSRNCLEEMGIRTLGDLMQTTEQELLSRKNFGETSLEEIRDMLASKGLKLGQQILPSTPVETGADLDLPPEQQKMLDRPISELNLSVRARKCMTRLNITTIGELVRKTGDSLLECKNFGVTSLNEVRQKLAEHGLKLRGE